VEAHLGITVIPYEEGKGKRTELRWLAPCKSKDRALR
jgi:hypothetical protein